MLVLLDEILHSLALVVLPHLDCWMHHCDYRCDDGGAIVRCLHQPDLLHNNLTILGALAQGCVGPLW